MSATVNIKNLYEDNLDILTFMPLNIETDFFEKMLGNLFVVEETMYYNNVCLSLVFYYVFVLHCLLSRLYKSDESNLELLKYIQITEKSLSKRDGSKTEHLKKFEKNQEVNHFLFNGKEKEAIAYFFHILEMSRDCQECTKNQAIIDLRNKIAHLNFFVADKEKYQNLQSNIMHNLGFISEKLYKTNKNIINNGIKSYDTDDFNYKEVFEKLNKDYYFSVYDYELFIKKKYINEAEIKNKTPKYYLKKYLEEDLGLSID